jgi:hypothetical protein
MPRCFAFYGTISGMDIVRCPTTVLGKGMVCDDLKCRSMVIRMWNADSAVAMSLSTYLCEGGDPPCKMLRCRGDGQMAVVGRVDNKPDVDKFMTQVGAGQSVVSMMEQCSVCEITHNSAKVNEELDLLSQEFGSLASSSLAYGQALEKGFK